MLHRRLGNKSASPLGSDTISGEEACLISLQIFHSWGLELSPRTHRCGRTVGRGKDILLLIVVINLVLTAGLSCRRGRGVTGNPSIGTQLALLHCFLRSREREGKSS